MKAMTSLVWLFALVLALVGCDSGAKETAPSSAKEPIIALTGTDLSFNGKPLKFGAKLEEWKQVIGGEPRNWLECYFWDGLGVFGILSYKNKNIVKTIGIQINRKPISPYGNNDDELPGRAFNTGELFQGTLDLDGVLVRQDNTVKEINKKLSKIGKIKEFYCQQGRNSCISVIVNGNKIVRIAMSTDDRKYDGTIFEIQISDSQIDEG